MKKTLIKHKVYDAFTDLEKAHNRVDWMAVQFVLKVYGAGERLLDGVKVFYRGQRMCQN